MLTAHWQWYQLGTTSRGFFRSMLIRVLSTVRKMSLKKVYPAPERNKTFILEVLQKHFDASKHAIVLEVAAGTGQHASYFAQHFPNFTYYPTEYEKSILSSIKAYADDTPTKNIKDPIRVDVTTDWRTWGLDFDHCDYMININMIHISPPVCSVRLFENAGEILKPGGIMVTYGPYAHNGIITPQSNIDFNNGLQRQDPSWGLKDINDLEKIANDNNIQLIKIYDLPANNKCLVWQKDM